MSEDNGLSGLIEKITKDTKKQMIRSLTKTIEEDVRQRFMKALGLKKSTSWQNDFVIIEGGYLDDQINTKKQIKQLKDDVRHTMRSTALSKVKVETVEKLQSSVIDYVRTIVEDDKTIEDMTDIHNFSLL